MKKNQHWGSSLDDFLKEEGVYETFKAQAEKEAIIWQLQEAMKAQKISSRTQVDKLLNPLGNVTLETLHRAAAIVGKRVEVRLV
jgi:antitoxin HicB